MTRIIAKFKVRGIDYKLVLFDSQAFDIIHPNTYAATKSDPPEIHVSDKGLSLETIRHEVVHAYMNGSLYNTCSEISMNDMEEMFAEVFAYFGPEMIQLSNKLHKIYLKEKKCLSRKK